MSYNKELFEIQHSYKPASVINMVRLNIITVGLGSLLTGSEYGSQYEKGPFGERVSCMYTNGISYCVAWDGESFVTLVCNAVKKKRKSGGESNVEEDKDSSGVADPEDIRAIAGKDHIKLFESALEMISRISVDLPGPKHLTTAIWSRGELVHFFKSMTRAYDQGATLVDKFFLSPQRVFSDIGSWNATYNIPRSLGKTLSHWGAELKKGPYRLTGADIASLDALKDSPGGLHSDAFSFADRFFSSQGIIGFSQWLHTCKI